MQRVEMWRKLVGAMSSKMDERVKICGRRKGSAEERRMGGRKGFVLAEKSFNPTSRIEKTWELNDFEKVSSARS